MRVSSLLICLFLSLALHAQEDRCPPDPDFQNPLFLEHEEILQEAIQQIKANPRSEAIRTIPVVIHVLYSNQTENISDRQIYSQLAVLNEDFRARNREIDRLPLEFKPLAADMEIEFCLATVSPDGLPTTGINRIPTTETCIGDLSVREGARPKLFYSDLGGQDIWDPTRYLNIYVASTCHAYLGRGFFPFEATNEQDGVIIDHFVFGTNCIAKEAGPFNLGRTTTHEIGHYLGLRHIWGSSTDCADDDGIEDTPEQSFIYRGCPPYPQFSCGSSDMHMNFMGFVHDRCMALFTPGQKIRMLATLDSFRPGLLESNACSIQPPENENILKAYPNPATCCIYIEFDDILDKPIEVSLYSSVGQLVYHTTNNPGNLLPISTNGLAQGVYFLQVIEGDNIYTQRIFIRG